jgi:hypothetical protein
MAKTKYTRELLAPLVAESTSFSDVIRKLGLPVNGGNHRLISGRIRHWRLDTSHFGERLRERVHAIPETTLRADIAAAFSFAHVLARHGLPPKGRAHYELKRRVTRLGIETSHFRGSGWSRGETVRTHEAVARNSRKRRLSDIRCLPRIPSICQVRES